MKLSKPLIAVIVVAILVVAGAAIAFAALSNQEKAGENDVRIGYLVGDLHQLSRVVAASEAVNETTIFDQYGIDAVFPNPGGYAKGPDIMDAFAAGALDAAWLGAPPVILKTLNSGTQVKIVAAANNEGTSLIAKDPTVNSLNDLKGKTVATPGLGSIQHLWLLSIAQDQGIEVVAKGTSNNPNAINWIGLPPAQHLQNLKDGTIDAAVGWEPYGSDSILDGVAHAIEWSGDAAGWENHPCCVLVVSTSFAEEHPDLVDKLVAAHLAANEWIANAQANPDSSEYRTLVEIAGKFSKPDLTFDEYAPIVKSALNHTEYTYELGETFKARLVNFTEKFIALDQISDGRISERGYTSISDYVDKLVDAQYLDRAANIEPED